MLSYKQILRFILIESIRINTIQAFTSTTQPSNPRCTFVNKFLPFYFFTQKTQIM